MTPELPTPNFSDQFLEPSRRESRRVLSAASLTGDRVVNRSGEDLGKLSEIMIDIHSGRIAYGVLSVGGFLGLGDRLFAIPWSRLTIDQEHQQIIFDVDRATLERAPGFGKEEWPDFSDPNLAEQLYAHYSAEPYWRSPSR